MARKPSVMSQASTNTTRDCKANEEPSKRLTLLRYFAGTLITADVLGVVDDESVDCC